MRRFALTLLMTLLSAGVLAAQPSEPDWSQLEGETLEHFRTLLQFDTSDPPGRELPAAEYLKRVLEADGIPTFLERVGGKHCSSPVYADGHLYFLSESGETVVLKAGPTFEVVARNALSEKSQASMAVSAGRVFIRTEHNLFCIGR